MRSLVNTLSLLAVALAACAGASARAPVAVAPPRSASAGSASALSAETRAEVELLIVGLFAESAYTREISARKLGAMGGTARPALAYLLDCMVGDDSDVVGAACATAVGGVGAAALPALERIAEQCPDRTARVALALDRLGAVAAPLSARLPQLPRGCLTPHRNTDT
jgi:hypothetical protein